MDSGLDLRTPTPNSQKGGRRHTCSDKFNDLMLNIRCTFERLNELWDEVDMPDDMRMTRSSTAFKHTNELFEDIIESERAMVAGVRQGIDDGQVEIEKLRAKLEMDDWTPPSQTARHGIRMLKAVRAEVQTLKEAVEERVREQEATVERVKLLCSRLGEESEILDSGEEVLSKAGFASLKEKCAEMENLVEERLSRLRQAQREARDAVKKMGRKKCDCPEPIQNLLGLDLDDEDLELGRNLVARTTEAAEQLLAELKEHLENMEFLYTEKRIALRDLWEKCHVPISDWTMGEEFSADLHDTATLAIMDERIAHLTELYERRKTVLDKLTAWSELWEEKLSHEEWEKDPARFNNRGGQLEKRLKRAKTVEKQLLPHAQREVANAFAIYQEENPEDDLKVDDLEPVEWLKRKVRIHTENKEFEAQMKRTPSRAGMTPAMSLRNLHMPDISVIGPCRTASPGPKTSSPKSAYKRPVPSYCSSPCPSPAKRATPLRQRNWKP
ncbi:unnamed protein product, partial [Mesorhabditis spiculigera]